MKSQFKNFSITFLIENCKLKIENSTRGFTLVEMIAAFAIFAMIMVISSGSLISLIEANHKAQALKTVVNNLNFALENMSRNLRTGYAYQCGASGAVGEPKDCAFNPEQAISFVDTENRVIAYRFNEDLGLGRIDRSIDGDTFVPITAPEVDIDQLRFYVAGAEDPSDNEQPRVLIVVKGKMLGRGKTESKFDIETMVSQRKLDI